MILHREPSDLKKAIELQDAGWRKHTDANLWFAPNCMAGQPLHAAYQSLLIGKRCEQPLVK